jgi:uncharacterized membrane protein YgaE (UPF0421/DUF939 family)
MVDPKRIKSKNRSHELTSQNYLQNQNIDHMNSLPKTILKIKTLITCPHLPKLFAKSKHRSHDLTSPSSVKNCQGLKGLCRSQFYETILAEIYG